LRRGFKEHPERVTVSGELEAIAYCGVCSCPGVDGTEDVRVGVGLIAAFESGDDDTLQAFLQHPTLKAMDNQVGKR
jgi:hypothetical protein